MAGPGRQTGHETDGRDGSQAPWRRDLFTGSCRVVFGHVVMLLETSTRRPLVFPHRRDRGSQGRNCPSVLSCSCTWCKWQGVHVLPTGAKMASKACETSLLCWSQVLTVQLQWVPCMHALRLFPCRRPSRSQVEPRAPVSLHPSLFSSDPSLSLLLNK